MSSRSRSMQADGFSFMGWNGGRKAPWRNGMLGMSVSSRPASYQGTGRRECLATRALFIALLSSATCAAVPQQRETGMSTTNTVNIVILVLYALIWAGTIVFLVGGLGGREPIPNVATI